MKDKEYHVANLQLLFPKLLFFPPQKWMNLILNWLCTASIKYLNWLSVQFRRFQNGCNKVVIEPRVVQFWSEIILVITNRTCAARSFDSEITHTISTQIALYSVQLPLKTIECFELPMHVLIIFLLITFIYMPLLQSLSW